MGTSATTDFVMVQLTAAGVDLAAGHVLCISAGRRHFRFEPGAPIRVERSYEWRAVLAHSTTPAGDPLCELVPEQAANAPGKPALVPAPESSEKEENR